MSPTWSSSTLNSATATPETLVFNELTMVPVTLASPVLISTLPPVFLLAVFSPVIVVWLKLLVTWALLSWVLVLDDETDADPLLLDPAPFPSLTTPTDGPESETPALTPGVSARFEFTLVRSPALLVASPVSIEVPPLVPLES